jgi:TPR repeat protein
MGVEIATLDPRMARGVGLPGVGGTMIVAVGGGSAAERAGLRAGDVLVKYDGKPVGEMAELPKLVAASAIGDDVTAEVWRVGQGLGDLLEALERRALNGDDDAAWTLFDIHRRKFGGVEDLGERIKWARRAATDGDMSAQFDMAVAYRDGTGVAKNPGEALSWARRAAEQGHAEAQWTVGSAYRNGIGVAKNLNEAFGWELKAAGQGIAIAQAMVGFAYEVGSGTERNTFEALGWYRKSAAQGNHYSEYKIGQFHAQGSGGVTVDNAEAEKWFRKAADAGFADAQHALANFYFDGTGGLAKNRSTAAGLYRKAADQGNALAQNMLGWLYENGEGVTRDPAEAERWWLKAAEAGNHDGQFWLGWAYSTSTVENTGFQRDDRKAAEYFRKAANQNHTMAMFNLAIAYDQGKGLAKDPREAGSLLVQSIKKGNDHAVTQLKTNSAGWSVELRREMQRLLQQAGHYSGAIDGQFGPGTSRALDALAKKG